MANDPFADPPVQAAQNILHAAGIKTGLQQDLPGGSARLQADRRPGRRQWRPGGRARLDRRADRGRVHAGVPAAALQPEDLHRRVRTGPGHRVRQRGRESQRQRDDGAERLVRRLQQPAEPGDGPGLHRQVRRHRVGHQRRRGRGLLGRRGRGTGRHRDPRHRQRQDHPLPAQRRHAADRAGPGEVQRTRREPAGHRVHLPVAERQVRPGAAGRRGRLARRSSTRSPPGPAEQSGDTERRGAEMGRQIYEADRRRDSRRRRLRADGRRADADLRRARHHQHRPGHPGGARRLSQLRALRAPAHRPVRRPADHGPGHVRASGVVIHWAFIRPLRGRERTSMSLLASYAVAIIIEGMLYWVFGPNYVHAERLVRHRPACACSASTCRTSTCSDSRWPWRWSLVAVPAAVPDQVRPQRPGHHAGPDRRPADRHRREPGRRADLRHRRRGHRGRRHGVRRHQRRLQPEQRLRPDLPAARHHHPRRPRQHRRRAGGRGVHDHAGVRGGHLVAELGRRGVLRGAGDRAHRSARPACSGGRRCGPSDTGQHDDGPGLPAAPGPTAAGRRVARGRRAGPARRGRHLPAGLHQRAGDHDRRGHADLRGVRPSAWNIFSGYSGYISLGHAVFFGTGAYTVGDRRQGLAADRDCGVRPAAAGRAWWRPWSRCRSAWSRCGSGGTRSS